MSAPRPFTKHTIFLTAAQEAAVRDRTITRKEATALLAETLLPEIVLAVGDMVAFLGTGPPDPGDLHHTYEIIRIEGDSILVRRLKANKAGPAGEVHETTLSKYVDMIRKGGAEVVV